MALIILLLEQRQVARLLAGDRRFLLIVPELVLGLRLPGVVLRELLVRDLLDGFVRALVDFGIEALAERRVTHQLLAARVVTPVVLDIGERVRASAALHRATGRNVPASRAAHL